jgi:NAD+ synthase/NAD+ synthase (glutamine-hydrolysing)
VNVALGQINPTVGDFAGNARKITEFAHRAQNAGAGLILFPELSVCGYPPRDLVERPTFVKRNRETIEQIAAETRGISVICGLVTPAETDTGKSVMNSAAWLIDGNVAFIQSKMLLPTYDVFDEWRNLLLHVGRNCSPSAAIAWRLRSVKTPGTTSISGPSACTRSIRWTRW